MNKLLFSISSLFLLAGCSSFFGFNQLSGIEKIAMCDNDSTSAETQQKIIAEHGFKKILLYTYQPVVKSTVFGSKVELISIEDNINKVYVNGNYDDLAASAKKILPNMHCQENQCSYDYFNGNIFTLTKTADENEKVLTLFECQDKK